MDAAKHFYDFVRLNLEKIELSCPLTEGRISTYSTFYSIRFGNAFCGIEFQYELREQIFSCDFLIWRSTSEANLHAKNLTNLIARFSVAVLDRQSSNPIFYSKEMSSAVPYWVNLLESKGQGLLCGDFRELPAIQTYLSSLSNKASQYSMMSLPPSSEPQLSESTQRMIDDAYAQPELPDF